MDCQDYITGPAERKKGQHLQREERGAIQHLKCQGYTNRAIAREIGCSPSTVANELRRGTPPRKSNKGRKPGYSARHGEAVYKANRKHSRKHHRICRCAHFLRWVVKQFKEHKDSKPREHKKSFGTDISQRPEIAALRIEEGHWEGDTVVGKRAGKEAVVLSLLEKKTENYIAIQIPGKDADSVLNAMQSLREEFGDKFSQVFKTITVDNGSEFSTFSLVENWGSAVYFAHPYTSWERPQNERHNGLSRAFVPKGASIESFSPE